MQLLTKYTSFSARIQPKKPVFQVGTGNIRQFIAKYQVSNTAEQPRKLVFQVATEKLSSFIGETASYFDESTIQETSFPGRQGKEKLAKKEKPLEDHRYNTFFIISGKRRRFYIKGNL